VSQKQLGLGDPFAIITAFVSGTTVEPSYRRTLKEAIVALMLWFGAGVWVISVSYWLGSGRPVVSIGGIPNWVLWGILLPWVTLFLIHSWYSLFFMQAGDMQAGDMQAGDDEPPADSSPTDLDGKRAG
jgi:TRAP-type C4-dicarboxylate transport system permease small subunit